MPEWSIPDKAAIDFWDIRCYNGFTNWNLAGIPNGIPSGVCVGNAFMRSATLDDDCGSLNGNFPRYIFRVLPFNPPFWKQYCAECMNAFPTKNLFKFQFITAKTIPGGYWGNDYRQSPCEFACGGTPPNSNLLFCRSAYKNWHFFPEFFKKSAVPIEKFRVFLL